MPNMDGYECSRLILEYLRDEEAQLPRVIAVTAQEDADLDPKWPGSGIEAVIKKPVDPSDLLPYL